MFGYAEFARRRSLAARSAATPQGKPSQYAPAISAAIAVTPPVRLQGGGLGWSLELIRSARDSQLRGQFEQPVRMAEAFRTNDALFTAYQARVATQSAVKLLTHPTDSDAGRIAAKRAELAICTPVHVRESIHGTMANHGLAIGYVQHETVDDPEYGPTVYMHLTEWPLEHVRYNPSTCTLETRTLEHGWVTITHGDGRWIVFRKFGVAPWTQDACVLPGALIWAAHGGCLSSWAGASDSHGNPKVIGTLREGVSLGNSETGELTPEARTVLNTLASLCSGDATAGILPHGASANMLFNGSTAWQVFKELILDRGKAAMRIYNGTDAALGSQGGAPGVDVASLFNVASTRIQGDFEALERGMLEGMIKPWAAMHGYAPADTPSRTYSIPDPDGERRSEQESKAVERLGLIVKTMKEAGLEVDQDTIDQACAVLGIVIACKLAAEETKSVPLQLAPTDVARVVRVDEARAAQGLSPIGDDRGSMLISELEIAQKAEADAAAAANTPTEPAEVGEEEPASPPPAEPETGERTE